MLAAGRDSDDVAYHAPQKQLGARRRSTKGRSFAIQAIVLSRVWSGFVSVRSQVDGGRFAPEAKDGRDSNNASSSVGYGGWGIDLQRQCKFVSDALCLSA